MSRPHCMARLQVFLVFVLLICVLQCAHLAESRNSHSRGCGKHCSSTKDCKNGLKCFKGKCKDDTHKGHGSMCKKKKNKKNKKKQATPPPLPPPPDSAPDLPPPDRRQPPSDSPPFPPPPGPGGPAKQCRPSGTFRPRKSFKCNDCCKAGKSYAQYKCSPPVTERTPAILTVNDFQPGGDGGGASACDSKYHSNNDVVVALSTGWFANRKRCNQFVLIKASNGKSVKARVVDECDSVRGCDAEHGFYPPCPPNLVDASPAVWNKLGISRNDDKFGWMDIIWSDL